MKCNVKADDKKTVRKIIDKAERRWIIDKDCRGSLIVKCIFVAWFPGALDFSTVLSKLYSRIK